MSVYVGVLLQCVASTVLLPSACTIVFLDVVLVDRESLKPEFRARALSLGI